MPTPLRVLMVEDSEDDALLIARALRRGGYAVTHARVDTPAGMRAALDREAWDVVIADYALPKFGGLEALRCVQSMGLDLPFIIVSGAIGETMAVAAMRAGAHDYVMKDNLARLVPAVRRELHEAQVRRAAHRSEEQIRKLSRVVEQSPVAVAISDVEGRVEYVNPKFTELTGHTAEMAVGQPSPGLRAGAVSLAQVREAVARGQEWRGEFCDHHQDGTAYWVALTVSAIRDAEGAVTHYTWISEDVTERKEAEDMLRRYNQRLSTLYELGRDISATLDLSTVLERIAAHAREVLSADDSVVYLLEPDETTLRAIVAQGTGAEAHQLSTLSLGEGIVGSAAQAARGEVVADVGQDARAAYSAEALAQPLTLVCAPLIFNERVTGMMALTRARRRGAFSPADLDFLSGLALQAAIAIENARLYSTEQARAAELARALEKQKELDRLKDQFIQNVSHELRTPLAIARGYAELLDDGTLGDLRKAQQTPVKAIVRRLRMLGKLIDDINTILEVESRPPARELVDMLGVVQSALLDFEGPMAQAQVSLCAELPETLPPVLGDAIHLSRVLDNLLGNALKFTPAEGTITVSLEQAGERLRLRVRDTGIGIPEDQLARVFERFYQVDGSMSRRYGGAGLGLALVKQIVEAHGGTVNLESEVGVGSTFTVLLPLVENNLEI